LCPKNLFQKSNGVETMNKSQIAALAQTDFDNAVEHRMTDAQLEVLNKAIPRGWKIMSVLFRDLSVAFVIQLQGCQAVVYPDGEMARAETTRKTVELRAFWLEADVEPTVTAMIGGQPKLVTVDTGLDFEDHEEPAYSTY
jgi:hypothetical protein